MTATHEVHDTIGLVFDFDDTLAPDSVGALLAVLGIDRAEWEKRWFHPLVETGWDEILARGYGLINAAKEIGRKIDPDLVLETAQSIEPYPGVMEMFERLRESAEKECRGVTLDFTILSAGFVNVIIKTELAKCFDRVWGSDFHHDESGAAVFVKRTVTHPEKALYLEALSKGLGVEGANAPEGVGRRVDEKDMRFPVDQMIYVGDGGSDLDAFAFTESHGGLAIAVAKDGKFAPEDKMFDGQKIENLAPPDFSEGGEMLRSLQFAVRSAAGRIALRRLSKGE
jgi:phosphoglycolate phosphatase-like HAD superfamily hydrolase